jgi:hypothetical protein
LTVSKADYRIVRFADSRGYAYCGVCHRPLFRRAFFANPERDPAGVGTLTQIERHVGDPYSQTTWNGLMAQGGLWPAPLPHPGKP